MLLKIMRFTTVVTLCGGFGFAVVGLFLMTIRDMGLWAILLWWIVISVVVTLLSYMPDDERYEKYK